MSTLLAILAIAVSPSPKPTQEHTYVKPCDRACQYDKLRLRVTAPYRGWLRSVRMCESGGNYRTATGNGFWGGYQFDLQTWRSVGGKGYPHQAAPLEQDYRAVILRKRRGTAPWPVCG